MSRETASNVRLKAGQEGHKMVKAAAENQIETEEEAQEYRKQVIADMDAEESGEASPVSTVSESDEDTPAATVPADTDATEDPWAGVNPALKAQFDTMSGKLEGLANSETRLKQAESRIGALTNELHSTKKAAADNEERLLADTTESESESDAKWEELKTDFPDWAEAIENRLAKVKSPEDDGKAIEKLRKTLTEETDEKIEIAVLSFVHPEWETTKESQPYKDWLKDQPEETIVKTKSSKAQDAIDVLDSFGEFSDQGEKPQKTAAEITRQRQTRLKKSVALKGGKADAPKSEEDMTDAEYRADYGKKIYAE
jgi:hypothetical protein